MLWSEIVLALFFLGLASFVARGSTKLFLPRHGRRHRLCGLLYLVWLLVGLYQTSTDDTRSASSQRYLGYDVVLGVLGTILTLTAAYDFKTAHEVVRNPKGIVSGTLSEQAIVSFDEMIEHSFYQALNLAQAIYIHLVSLSGLVLAIRAALLFAVTAPWLVRSRFPVHSFSANYTRSAGGGEPFSFINILYRTKKYQYLLYKHLLLHGLNVALAVTAPPVLVGEVTPLGATRTWRAYWLCLNTAYTMEFFLQTLVRRRHLSQTNMLSLNTLLMVASTVAAVQVVHQHIATMLPVGILSCLLNFVHRHHELQNVFLCALAVWGFAELQSLLS